MKTRNWTGRSRHIVMRSWFRQPVLVLQREYRYKGVETVHEHGAPFERAYDFTIWEYARPRTDCCEVVDDDCEIAEDEE